MSATKITGNTTNILKLLFFIINLHCVTSISTYRKLNLPLTSNIYFVFLPPEIQKRLEQTRVFHVFLLCLKRNNPQTFKNCNRKNPFLECVSYCLNLVWWMFFILLDNWKTLLFMNVYWYSLIFFKCHVAAFFESSVLKEVLILYVISAITIPKFQNKANHAS